MSTNRRTFIIQSVLGASSLALATMTKADAAILQENDATAQSLGYHADASKTDTKKYINYKKGQDCGNCTLFKGAASDKMGGCAIFGSKQVATKGWCSAYSKKA